MKILLLCCDLFKTIGGGQSVYRHIIENTPEAEFYYFSEHENLESLRPGNAHPISLPLVRPGGFYEKNEPLLASHWRQALDRVAAFASAVAGQHFDIVESPDYETFGASIRQVFSHYGVRWGRVVLAMHGNISTSCKLNWQPAPTLHMKELEARQFREADGVYSLSRVYMDEWQKRCRRDVEYIDPLHFVFRPGGPPPYYAGRAFSRPDICCLGRLEKRKGNDIAQELTRWLPRESYGRLRHIGADEWIGAQGRFASQALAAWAKNRGLTRCEYAGPMDVEQMAGLYSRNNVVVLPVRYDSLNLVALESLFHGCPAAVSSRAGVCDYLDNQWPGLPYVKIDLANLYSCLADLRRVLENYDQCRAELAAYLADNPVTLPPLDMAALYKKILDAPPCAGAAPKAPLARRVPLVERARQLTPKVLQKPVSRARRLASSLLSYKNRLRATLRAQAKHIQAWSFSRQVFNYARWTSEESAKHLESKISRLYGLAESTPLHRVMFWRELARLEDLRRNPLFSATYKLRVMRALGDDRFGLLEGCAASLTELGFAETAAAATALYQQDDAGRGVYDFLQAARARHLNKPDAPYEALDDSRPAGFQPLVSVIVSLYQAADKLDFFLTALAEQSLARKVPVELIIQDSASPRNERGALGNFLAAHPSFPFRVVYGRSPRRETIQAAWNRGIKLARAPYLVFLGVDEGLYPGALERLAGELEKNPGVDWVMANSLVTETDKHGALNRDIMTYDRRGGSRDHGYLESCYLSYVGGMYRRSIHDRFGYYDESFRGAGDTEFKNRVLPDIRVKFLPIMLGIFFNYPEERTTASPMAEIEDTRAWYIHRSLGGVRYAFEDYPEDRLEALLGRALGYRKSYCGHISTDFEYGWALARYGLERGWGGRWPALAGDVKRLREILVTLDSSFPTWKSAHTLATARKEAQKIQERHRGLPFRLDSSYSLFNDNRYEQHSWLWKSVKTSARP